MMSFEAFFDLIVWLLCCVVKRVYDPSQSSQSLFPPFLISKSQPKSSSQNPFSLSRILSIVVGPNLNSYDENAFGWPLDVKYGEMTYMPVGLD